MDKVEFDYNTLNFFELNSRDHKLTQIVKLEQGYTSDLLLERIKNFNKVHYFKRDYLFKDGIWREKKVLSSNKIKKNLRKIAVIGHSDIHTTIINQLHLMSLGYKKIFGTNLNPVKKISISLPLGLTNFTNESPRHLIFGNQSLFSDALEIAPKRNFEFRHEIYVNMSIQNAKSERMSAINAISILPFTKIDLPEISIKGRVNYLKNLRQCAFVLCPQGNGVDTHRIWETLYMGSIPIIKKNPSMNFLVKDLPVVLVDSWVQAADEKFLQKKWFELHSTQINVDKLTVPYWVEKIKSHLA